MPNWTELKPDEGNKAFGFWIQIQMDLTTCRMEWNGIRNKTRRRRNGGNRSVDFGHKSLLVNKASSHTHWRLHKLYQKQRQIHFNFNLPFSLQLLRNIPPFPFLYFIRKKSPIQYIPLVVSRICPKSLSFKWKKSKIMTIFKCSF